MKSLQKFTAKEVKTMMHDAAYAAEQLTFSECIIKKGFKLTGLFPWEDNLIFILAEKNAGRDIDDTKMCFGGAMQEAVTKQTWSRSKDSTLVHGKANVQASTLFTPFQVLENVQMLEQTKANALEARIQRKEDARFEAEAKRLAQTCAVADCNRVSHRPEGTKVWRCCTNCGTLFCKEHVDAFLDHVVECDLLTVTTGESHE